MPSSSTSTDDGSTPGGGSAIHGPLPAITSVTLSMISAATTSAVGPYTLYTGGISTPTIRVAGVNAGNRIRLYAWDANSGPYICTTVSAEQTATTANEDLIISPGLTNGYWIVIAVLDDGSGTNTGCPSISDVTGQVVSFVYYNLTVVATPPTSMTLISPASDTSYNARPTVQVGGLTSGDTVGVYSDSSCTTLVGSATATGTTANITLTTSISTGAATLYSKRTTSGGTASSCSTVNLPYTVLAPTGGLPTFSGIALSMNGVGAAADYGGGLYVYSGSIAKPELSITGINVGNRIKIYQWEGSGPYTCTNLVAESGADTTTVTIQVTTAATGTVVYVPVVDDGSGSNTGCPSVAAFPNIPYAYYVFVPPVSAPSGLARQSPTSATGRDDTPTIRVSGVTSGHTIKLFTDSSCTTQVASGVAAATTIDLTTSTLTDGSYTFYANATDASSTSSCSTANVTYTLSTSITAPSALSLTNPSSSPDANPSPVINVDGVVAGDDVNIYTNNTCTTLVGTATANATNVDVSLNSALVTDGTYNFYAKSVNGALSSSCSTAHVQYILSSAIPEVTSIALISPTSSRGLSLYPIIRVSGVANGDTVGIFSDSSCTTQIATGYPTGTTVDVSLGLTAGDATWSFYATRVNGYYHSGCSTATAQYSVDTGGYVSVSAMSKVSIEGDGAQHLAVTLSAVKSYPVTVYFNTIGSTGVLGTHYSLATSSVTIPAGQSSANISYSILENALTDGEKYLQINLEATDEVGIINVGTNSNFRHLIRDNEGSLNSTLSISIGSTAVCAIVTGGILKCWGSGYVGDGTVGAVSSPTVIDSGTAYSKVSVGGSHACAITTIGNLKCWGLNNYSQVGDGTATPRTSPVQIDIGTTYTDVSVGVGHACGITSGGVLKCWGSINYAIDTRSSGGNVTTPTVIPVGGVLFQSTSVGGGYNSCAVATNNDLYCWGAITDWGVGYTNQYDPVLIGTSYSKANVSEHLLGIKTNGDLYCGGCTTGVFAVVDSGVAYSDARSFYLFGSFSFVGLTTTGDLKYWGWNFLGNMGPLGGLAYNTLVTIDSNVSLFAMGYGTVGAGVVCTIKNNVTVCSSPINSVLIGMGDANYSYGTMIGDFTIVASPTTVMGSVSSVMVGISTTSGNGNNNHNCAIDNSGYLYCWGYETPDGMAYRRLMPIKIDRSHTYSKVISFTGKIAALRATGELMFMQYSPVGFESIDPGVVYTNISASGAGDFNGYLFCGLTSSSILKCWGYTNSGACCYIGDGSTYGYVLTPSVIDSGVTYSQMATGLQYRYFNCAITSAGTLKCWGYNNANQINSSGGLTIYTPQDIDPGVQYTKVSLAFDYGCGITTSGALKCWGSSYFYQASLTVPTIVDSGVNYSDVVLSNFYGCGIVATTNELKCWGYRADDAGVFYVSPTTIDSGVGYAKVAIVRTYGSNSTSTVCGITTAGVLKCWGTGDKGQIANGSLASQVNPVVVDAGTNYSDVKMAEDGTQVCGVTTGSVLKCWGMNYQGASINGQTPNRLWNRPVGLEP